MPRRTATNRFRTWAIGASVAGPRHQREGVRNHDAWGAAHRASGAAIVVADGVGSARYAAEGSRLACKATIAVFSRLEPRVDLNQIPRSISREWLQRLPGERPAEFATTLLFAIRFTTGRLIVGGVGDGLTAVCSPELPDRCRILVRPGGEFGETFSISSRADTGNWRIEEFDDAACTHRVILATDGVSNDLLEPRIAAMTEWLRNRFEGKKSRIWRTGIRSLLMNWPTPGSSDDKTLAMLWRAQGVPS